MHLLLRYTQALITQMAQTAVCNRHHSVDQQLCRWLLLSLDRLQANELTMTQELIANMLGVRREGRHRGRREIAGRRVDSLPSRPDQRGRSSGSGGAGLRVLRGGQDGIRSSAALRRQVAPSGSCSLTQIRSSLDALGRQRPRASSARREAGPSADYVRCRTDERYRWMLKSGIWRPAVFRRILRGS